MTPLQNTLFFSLTSHPLSRKHITPFVLEELREK